MKLKVILACLLLMLAAYFGFVRTQHTQSGKVNAQEYDAFWIWGGLTPQPVLSQANTLYILQGEVREKVTTNAQTSPQVQLIAQGMAVPRLKKGSVWLVYRANTLHWTPEIYQQIMSQMKKWTQFGNPVVGLQIDFDARTQHLQEYAEFLKGVRDTLPANYKLSITGLMDWGTQADVQGLNKLASVVDEIVVQTYQGRETISNYKDYLSGLERLNMPFKVGLVQGGDWDNSNSIKNHPNFRGFVVFLKNP